IFFVMYFFIPSMGMKFLGVSFALREGSLNAQVLDVISEQSQGNPDFSSESFVRLQQLLSSPEVQERLKEAAKEGQQALESAVQQLTERAE
ncbi:MAG: hypothetical protein PWP25_1514, partial [Sphaerochaeta sp.]|nr:hypothetical protein [Sphaerochaeta sp.]